MHWNCVLFFAFSAVVHINCQQKPTNDYPSATRPYSVSPSRHTFFIEYAKNTTNSTVMPTSTVVSIPSITASMPVTNVSRIVSTAAASVATFIINVTSSMMPSSVAVANVSSAGVSNMTAHINSSLIIPSTTSMPVNSTAVQNATAAPHPTATVNITIMPSSAATHHIMSSSIVPTSTPKPRVIIECGDECKSLQKRMYVAAVFAVLFVIVAMVLGVLLYRQWKISRDRDDQMSRLI